MNATSAPPATRVSTAPLRVLFALSGLHKVNRGAEVAFESIAHQLSRSDGFDVTVIGSGTPRQGRAYHFLHSGCLPRDRFQDWPHFPGFRSDGHYEELTFAAGFLRRFQPDRYDVVVTCSFPFLNWAVRARRCGRRRPVHVFVTQNGDWPLFRKNSEYRLFGCDAVVCTNPDYFETHGEKWPSRLIPNGVDCTRFHPGPVAPERCDLPEDRPIVLMVSALIESKRVAAGIEATAQVPEVALVVAGDGHLSTEIDALGSSLMRDRYRRVKLPPHEMPALYRRARVLLHMSLDEPFGNAYIEALATGVPIVAHDRRATRWILGPHSDFVVDTRDLPAVAGAIRRALDSGDRRAESADYARERYSWDSISFQYAEFFKALTSSRR